MTGLAFAAPAAGLYLLGALRQWLTVTGRKPSAKQLVLVLTALAAILHGVSLSQSLFVDGTLNLSFFQVGSLISLVITLLLLFSSWRKPVENLFVALLPMAATVSILASTIERQVLLTDVNEGMMWHIVLAILAYSIFTIASVQAILLTIQDKNLRHHKTRGIIKALPPLQTMDLLLFEMLWIGMIMLSLSFIVGFPYIHDLFAQHLVHKIVFAILGWIIFAILLVGRYQFGWRGIIASRWTLVGMGFLILSYFGVQFVLEFLLNK